MSYTSHFAQGELIDPLEMPATPIEQLSPAELDAEFKDNLHDLESKNGPLVDFIKSEYGGAVATSSGQRRGQAVAFFEEEEDRARFALAVTRECLRSDDKIRSFLLDMQVVVDRQLEYARADWEAIEKPKRTRYAGMALRPTTLDYHAAIITSNYFYAVERKNLVEQALYVLEHES